MFALSAGKSLLKRSQDPKPHEGLKPHEDYGFFGPASITWKVWLYPTSLTVGFQRAVTIEELDPALVAAVDATQAIVTRPRSRYDRTLHYFALIAFGDSRTASKASDVLVKIHSKAIGTEPLNGTKYDANDPKSQLWIHLTAWHSILYAYERFGPGRLSAKDEAQYWQECARAAELQTCDPVDVPRTREGIQDYFAQMRPKLAGSETAQRMMDHLLHADIMLPPVPRVLRPGSWFVAKMLRYATIATMPQWMRKMSGLRQSRFTDAWITIAMKAAFKTVHVSRWAEIQILAMISPATLPVVEPVLRGVAPTRREVIEPEEARQRYGYDRPSQAHLELRARQTRRVFGDGILPSDEGIIESQDVLGSLA